MLTGETIMVLHRAIKLDKVFILMVVKTFADFEDGGKAIIRKMLQIFFNYIIFILLKPWTNERLKKGRECINWKLFMV